MNASAAPQVSDASPLIELSDAATASVRAPETPQVEGINWRVRHGEFWVVAGLPGSGKSGLLETVAGLVRPLRGRHALFGHEIHQLAEKEFLQARLRIGLVFSDGGRLFNHLTVAQNVALPLCYHRDCTDAEAAQRVGRLLESLGLTDVAHHLAARLSRSWRQRAGLARALLLQPEVLLLDNPLAGLDPRQTRWWLDFLAVLAAGHELLDRRPLTLAVVCEDLRSWLDQAQQFALIKEKSWLPLGGRAEVTASAEPLVRELSAATTTDKS